MADKILLTIRVTAASGERNSSEVIIIWKLS